MNLALGNSARPWLVVALAAPGLPGCSDDVGNWGDQVDPRDVAELAPEPPAARPFHLGADISWAQRDEHYGSTFVDLDGEEKDVLELMKSHGFNSVRLRTFVDPMAPDGYDQVDGFADLEHTVEMGRRVKEANMSFFLALHYSDNWADPGKQCIPWAWQGSSLEELVEHLRQYTLEVVGTLVASGARPDMVQVGNEITWGMLFHHCDSMGLPVGERPAVNGSSDDWESLGRLLRAGVEAVREVDPEIEIVMQTDKGGDLRHCTNWIDSARAQGVDFDVFAGTTYVRYQGQPSAWQYTYEELVRAFPELGFMIPEYSNESATEPPAESTIRLTNDLVFGLPEHQGVGTWFYEPAHPFIGSGLFETVPAGAEPAAEPAYVAVPTAMAEYDRMRDAYAPRLWRADPSEPGATLE